METTFAFGDPRTQTVWAPDMFEYALQTYRFLPLLGTDGSSVIHVNRDLTQGPGGNVLFESFEPITGAGQGDGGDTRGKEAQLKYRNMNVRVHTRMHSTIAEGQLALQLTALYKAEAFRNKSKTGLGSWIREINENDIITCASGLYNENSGSADIETINEAYPTSPRMLYLGQTVDATPTLAHSGVSFGTDALLSAETVTENLFGTLVIDKLRAMAVTATPRIRTADFFQTPSSIEKTPMPAYRGMKMGSYYPIMASSYQINSVRAELGDAGFNRAIQNAEVRGAENPLFSGGSFMWRGCLVIEYDRIPYRTGAGSTTLSEGFLLNAGRTATTDEVASGKTVARGCLLGQQAISWGWALQPGWWEGMEDTNKPKIKTEMLYGVKRTQFNSHGTTSAGAEEAIINFDTMIQL